ncbi:MAG TPA: D-glycero-beta-D-manno-heptose-7-phosphate kinase [Alphaproteobacteria bacterium]|nr:D-glycero-beta-D-manno-heptose-7-phosphate kinase [Alphaproteobacteria bacterium]
MDFSQHTVLCIGDIMLDRFFYGDIERISPEAPIPVLRKARVVEMLGGVGNVANNITSLGGKAIVIGLVGKDSQATVIRDVLLQKPAMTSALVETEHRPTISKTRFIAARQQIVRADEESNLALQPSEERDLIAAVERMIPGADAVILSDYGKSTLSLAVIAKVISLAQARGIPVFVDPKTKDFSRYRGATCITPNLKELALASGMAVDDEESVIAAARQVLAGAEAQAILATRSEKGMILVEAGGEVHTVAAKAREVFDVSGAGDTVIATMALACASGLSMAQAVQIANAAAGIVVGKPGTATADIGEVVQALNDEDASANQLHLRVQSHAEVDQMIQRWRAQGFTIGFTNGCFDILHSGHIALFEAARAQCDRLVVALNSDESIQRLKGPTRPINSFTKRARVVAAIRFVDCVTEFGDDTPFELIKRFVPDVLIKGADYTVDTVVGADVVTAAGGRVYLAPLIAGESTTNIISRSRERG